MAKENLDEVINSLKSKDKVRILFVCLGNICRSPAAEGVFNSMAEEAGLTRRFEVDSAGLYAGHAGELPDRRMRVHAFQRGYNLIHHSRPVKMSDFEEFDLIVAMDDSNYQRLCNFAPTLEDERKVVRMIDFVTGFSRYDCVPDPYYEGAEGFELVLNLLEDGCRNLLELLKG